MFIDLTDNLMKSMKSYPRTLGRYNASEMYAIFAGWTTPETWIKPEERTSFETKRMWKGIWGHNQIQSLLKAELCERKVVYEYKDIKLVAKADYLPDGEYINQIWEFKTNDDVLDKSKPWQDHQAKLYTKLFDRDKTVILQPIETESQIMLKIIGEVKRDDVWFEKQMEKLYEFHLKVKEIWKK